MKTRSKGKKLQRSTPVDTSQHTMRQDGPLGPTPGGRARGNAIYGDIAEIYLVTK